MYKPLFVGHSEEALSLLHSLNPVVVTSSDLKEGSVPNGKDFMLAIVHWHQGLLPYLEAARLMRTRYPQAKVILLKDDPAYFDVSPEDDEAFDYIFAVSPGIEKASKNGKFCALKPENVLPALNKIMQAAEQAKARPTPPPVKIIDRDLPKRRPSSTQEKRTEPTPSTHETKAQEDAAPLPREILVKPAENEIVGSKQTASTPLGLPNQQAKSLCPYPHKEAIDSVNSAVAFSSCFECNMPVVICEECGEPNRTVARACTACKAPLDSVDIEQRFLTALDLKNQPRLSNSINLDEFGAKTIVELLPALGYLFVRTAGAGVLVFCAYQPEKILLALNDGSEPVGMTFIWKPQDQEGNSLPPYMLISTQQRIFRVHFLPNLEYVEEPVKIRPGECIRFQPFLSLQGLTYFTYHEGQKYTALCTANGAEKIPREYGNNISAPIQTASGRIVFYTSNGLFIFNPHESNPKTRTQGFELKLPVDINNVAVNVAASNEVIIPSKDRLLRIDPTGIKPVVRARLNVNGSGYFSFGASDDGKQLYVGDARGISIINAFDGRQIWNLKSDLFIEADCGQTPPRQYGRFLVFIALTNRGRKIGLLDLLARNKVFWIGEENWYSASPVLCADKLIFATKNSQGHPELKVHQLT